MGFSLPNPSLFVGWLFFFGGGGVIHTSHLSACFNFGRPRQCSFLTMEERLGWIGSASNFIFYPYSIQGVGVSENIPVSFVSPFKTELLFKT